MNMEEQNENIRIDKSPETKTLFGKLPPKVKRIVIEKLPFKERLLLRTLSRNINREVTPFIVCSIKIDDTEQGRSVFQFFRSMERIRSVKVLSLAQEIDIPRNIFHSPGKIEKIEVSGKLALTNLGQMLSYDGLRTLILDTNGIVKVVGQYSWDCIRIRPFPNLQQNLKSLTLWGPLGDNLKVKNSCPALITGRFLHSRFLSLTTFKLINIESDEKAELDLTALILRFLVVHCQTIRTAYIKCTSVPQRVAPRERYSEELPQPYQRAIPVELLNKIKLFDFSVTPFQSGTGVSHWITVVLSQANLKEFSGNITNAPFAIYKPLIDKNYRSLITIRLTHISIWDGNVHSPINLGIFAKCSQLKRLTLKRQPLYTSLQNRSSTPELYNIASLPDTLNQVSFDSFRIKASALIDMTGVLSGLKSLSIHEAGTGKKFGVSIQVLLEILLKFPKLEKLSILPLNIDEGETKLADKVFKAVGKNVRTKSDQVIIDWEFKNRINPLSLVFKH